jgi:hypothetical protein
MNAVGIDVSKGKSMIAILRPYGEIVTSPFEIKHTCSDIKALIDLIKSIDGESRIVMEHTGRYYEPLAHQLSQSSLFVSAINPKLIKDFGDKSLRKVKSDKADAVKIARYALDSWTELKQYSPMDEIRNQLKTMNRQFGFYMRHKTAMKNNLIGILDQTYPDANTFFSSPAMIYYFIIEDPVLQRNFHMPKLIDQTYFKVDKNGKVTFSKKPFDQTD